jgi:hypothetical protein
VTLVARNLFSHLLPALRLRRVPRLSRGGLGAGAVVELSPRWAVTITPTPRHPRQSRPAPLAALVGAPSVLGRERSLACELPE